MNISSPIFPAPESDEAFRFERLHLRENDLQTIRMELYHSTGPGFHVFKRFVSPDLVSHMRSVWPKNEMPPGYRLLPATNLYYPGCPNYYVRYPDDSLIFFNFLHQPPLDEATQEVSVAVHMLRNRLSGRNAFQDLAGSRSLGYRVTLNRNFEAWIKPHRDFMDWDKRWVKGEFDPSRLQATLVLSNRGVDYSGNGFLFQTNSGSEVMLGGDVPVDAGDLLIWRYGNLHSVENVKCTADQFGFMRIIYPIYDLNDKPPVPPTPPSLPARVWARARLRLEPVRVALGQVKRRLF
jgi:hypothetical protein